MDTVEKFFHVSRNLFSHLATMPEPEDRDEYIEQIERLLEEREQSIYHMNRDSFIKHPNYELMIKLDQGIKAQLAKLMSLVKQDIINTSKVKKTEQSYLNPYSATTTLDGMYFDKKK